MELKDLLTRAKALPKEKQRCVGAILGAVTADAAGCTLLNFAALEFKIHS